ncbi:MAG: hypothetical protein M1379_08260 [Firmicutes bacterium]|nr:hypothetical protein [Bacillota bacterium]
MDDREGLVLGVDAGGSKTVAVVSSPDGELLGEGESLGGNYQGEGIGPATAHIREAVFTAFQKAEIDFSRIAVGVYGVAGADGPDEFAIVESMIKTIHPASSPYVIVNDAALILQLAAVDLVGVGMVCGTGTNCMAFGPGGKRWQIGGMGFASGDQAGGLWLGTLALHHASRAEQGRGPETGLLDALKKWAGVGSMAELISNISAGSAISAASGSDPEKPAYRWSDVPPLIFEVADAGDEVARSLLRGMGEELAVTAAAAVRKHFAPGTPVAVAVGGSLVQKQRGSLLVEALAQKLAQLAPAARLTVPFHPPVYGAILMGMAHLTAMDAGRQGEILERFPVVQPEV